MHWQVTWIYLPLCLSHVYATPPALEHISAPAFAPAFALAPAPRLAPLSSLLSPAPPFAPTLPPSILGPFLHLVLSSAQAFAFKMIRLEGFSVYMDHQDPSSMLSDQPELTNTEWVEKMLHTISHNVSLDYILEPVDMVCKAQAQTRSPLDTTWPRLQVWLWVCNLAIWHKQTPLKAPSERPTYSTHLCASCWEIYWVGPVSSGRSFGTEIFFC